ncbi:hypothetical protein GCK72_006741 [Caenorhabditis remanei]|uniref:Uncharacterized protein n=1 Tax=Caenorhabditis remanei TaxID=31234 RepID=A0A6A5HK66_CAERE|nr:hypothetical protein GCK72_006741 [Caenorhabditis remanei]KAF1766783.1 hypothetical protein GCK72_006741 [Caenorhabditis remanei]
MKSSVKAIHEEKKRRNMKRRKRGARKKQQRKFVSLPEILKNDGQTETTNREQWPVAVVTGPIYNNGSIEEELEEYFQGKENIEVNGKEDDKENVQVNKNNEKDCEEKKLFGTQKKIN